jgi:hypothetical protein
LKVRIRCGHPLAATGSVLVGGIKKETAALGAALAQALRTGANQREVKVTTSLQSRQI